MQEPEFTFFLSSLRPTGEHSTYTTVASIMPREPDSPAEMMDFRF